MKKKISLYLVCILSICMLVGCGSKSKGNRIIVWAKCNEKEKKALQELCDNWEGRNGQTIEVVSSQLNPLEYSAVKEAKTDGPDIIWGMSSEKTGWLVENNCVEAVKSGIENVTDYIDEDLVKNTSIDGIRYGVPISMETLALFYNKDKVTEVPKDMTEFLKLCEKEGLSFDINNGYFSYGFLSTYGGYVFKNDNGNFNYNDIGLNSEGAVKGYTMLQDICNKYKVMSKDNTDDTAEACFSIGKSAFYIGEQKKISNFVKNKMNFGVTTIPSIDGQDFKPFKEIKMAFVNPNSVEKDQSYNLLKYLIDNSGSSLIKDGDRLPVLKKNLESEDFKNNEYLQGFYEQSKSAEVTPNIPELDFYWDVMNRNLQTLINENVTPEECGKTIEKEIKKSLKDKESV